MLGNPVVRSEDLIDLKITKAAVHNKVTALPGCTGRIPQSLYILADDEGTGRQGDGSGIELLVSFYVPLFTVIRFKF